ncbi:MAG: hypothetical protein B7X08_02510 [Acidocella sp. 20-63-7]|nr:MAG: hypothetical protein B7X08_02510 [Acidocella sp. 20-63-7]HQT46280.1 type II secretion system F family protein [Acidocella sp.]
MIFKELLTLFVFIVILLSLSGVALFFVVKEAEREKKFKSRLHQIIEPSALPNPDEEEVSLSRTVSRGDMIKARAASLIGVDLQQSETYPIKWWLVPPITLGIALVMTLLASHPFHNYKPILYVVGLPIEWLVLTKAMFNSFTTRRNSKLLEQFPDALSTIVRCVRVGIPMGEALRTVSRDALEPTKGEFNILADKVSIGIPLDVALRELAVRIKLTEYQFFATALTLQARSGGGITQTLETLAEVIRRRVGLKARGLALTAEARTSSGILAALPFIAGIAIFFMQRPYMMLLFTTSSGQSVLALAILMLGTGLGVIKFMINSVLK